MNQQTYPVGVYRIRPDAPTYPRRCFQGVCDTPLQMFLGKCGIHITLSFHEQSLPFPVNRIRGIFRCDLQTFLSISFTKLRMFYHPYYSIG